jgi:soluble lytic murein transglycosylase
MAGADREIVALENRMLLGHVLADRYLGRSFKPTYRDLADWLAQYPDHPQARRIHKLANNRKPAGMKLPEQPKLETLRVGYFVDSWTAREAVSANPGKSGPEDSDKASRRAALDELQDRLNDGDLHKAERMLASRDIRTQFSDAEIDRLRLRVASAHLFGGNPRQALPTARLVTDHSNPNRAAAHWIAGLAAWQLRRLDIAREHFETLAMDTKASPWMRSSAAFWAARVHLVDRRPQKVSQWLRVAAEQPRTFYGMIATRSLGIEPDLNWDVPNFGAQEIKAIRKHAGGERALALLQLRQTENAEAELKLLAAENDNLYRPIFAIAARTNMPSLSYRLTGLLNGEDGRVLDAGLYPVPEWQPEQGFTVNPALLFGLVRQESAFDVGAKSQAGALGLMQLMPDTANSMGAGKLPHADMLLSPEVNLEIGQRYVENLMGMQGIGGNLVLLAAAYNAGPRHLLRWRKSVEDMNDPLLFIEMLPRYETRMFVKRVLTNFWIYQFRMGQKSPSLDAIAAGRWPLYHAPNGSTSRTAGNVTH